MSTVKKTPLKILIYGGGAVGLGLASCLLKAKQTVTIIARPETARQLKSGGLTRRGIFGDFFAPAGSFAVESNLADIAAESFDFVLVTTKSFDSEAAAGDIARYPALLKSNGKIVLCQNGWGNAEVFQAFFPTEKIFNARVITGFTRPQPAEVVITVHAEPVKIGNLFGASSDAVVPLCGAITTGDLPCQATKEIGKDIWAKMLYNCALNPLGAIFGVPYGQLADFPTARRLMDTIIDEIFAVMTAAGYQTHWATPDEYRTVFYNQLVPATKEHRSSTLQAIKAGKRAEVGALNGMVIRLAEKFDCPAPVNQTISLMVKFLEELNAKN